MLINVIVCLLMIGQNHSFKIYTPIVQLEDGVYQYACL